MLWGTIVPLALLVACSTEKHVRILIVPEQTADAEARQKKVTITDIVFKKNQGNKIDEHPFVFSRDKLESHGDGCEKGSLLQISISKKEEVVWEADSAFKILSIQKSACGAHPMQELSPANPFYGSMPYTSTAGAPFNVHSGPARPESVNQMYKIRIEINGQILDPDLICMM
jgi:hypothetical protein